MSSDTVDAGEELRHFIKLAREIFHDEAWDQVEPYVARAWRACPGVEEATWPEVRPLVRAEWD